MENLDSKRTFVGFNIDEQTILGLKAISLAIRQKTGAKLSTSAIIRAALTAVVAAKMPVEPFTSEAAAQAFLTERLLGNGEVA